MSAETSDPIRCPKCWSADLRYSHDRRPWDNFLNWFLSIEVFRCRKCHNRFHKRLAEAGYYDEDASAEYRKTVSRDSQPPR